MKPTPKINPRAAALLCGAVFDRDELAAKPIMPQTADWYAAPIIAARDFNQVRLAPACWLGRPLTPSDHVSNSRAYHQLETLGLVERITDEFSNQTAFLQLTEAGLAFGRMLSSTKISAGTPSAKTPTSPKSETTKPTERK